MQKLSLNYGTDSFRLCFDNEQSGFVIGERLKAPFAFSDHKDLFLKIDHILDVQNHPRAYQEKRVFQPGTAPELPYALTAAEMLATEEVEKYRGAFLTLILHITSRQNSCWQGSLREPGQEPSLPFQSILQLMRCLDALIADHHS